MFRKIFESLQQHMLVWVVFFQIQEFSHTLTSHGAESKPLLRIIVMSGTAPSHAIPATISGAVGVVTTTVEEGEVTQGTVGVSTSCCYNGWMDPRGGKKTRVTVSFDF